MNLDMLPFVIVIGGVCIIGIIVSMRELLSSDRKTLAELLREIDPDPDDEEEPKIHTFKNVKKANKIIDHVKKSNRKNGRRGIIIKSVKRDLQVMKTCKDCGHKYLEFWNVKPKCSRHKGR